MTTIITRIFATRGQADAAVAQLRQHGLRADEINLVAGGSAMPAAQIAKGGLSSAQAAAYAGQLGHDGALVTAHARFGLASGAVQILEAHGPVASAHAQGEQVARQESNPTPLSTFLDIPTLSKSPTPFAAFWNLPGLTKSATPLSSLFSLPTLSNRRAFLTFGRLRDGPVFGMQAISHSPTPLSSALGLPTLSKKAPRRY